MQTKSITTIAILSAIMVTAAVITFYPLSEQKISIEDQFKTWKQKYNVNYLNECEETYRLGVFTANFIEIKEHNAKKLRYTKGINQFSDLTQDEFVAVYLLPPSLQPKVVNVEKPQSSSNLVLNDGDVDWVKKGYVTNVKDQGQCGACWAFSALGSLEAVNMQKGNPLVSLSAQQLLDCSTSQGNHGCNGGYMTASFTYIKKQGIVTQHEYPYKGVYQQCKIKGGPVKVKSFVEIDDCTNLASALMARPIAIAIDATKFYSYQGGVFDGCSKTPMLNHASTLVGMTKDYWIAKQLWGTKWGQDGYIRLARGNTCGLCNMASYPVM